MGGNEALIGIDWGTSSFRAYLLGADGAIHDRITALLGVLKIADKDFERVFEETVGTWLRRAGAIPTLLTGTIGSRQGWLEVPYLPCPADVQGLADGLRELRTRSGYTVHFVPGVSCIDEDGVLDVMRGEETEVFGALGARDAIRQVFVLPGTHSKWVLVEDGRIVRLATFMTGEVFAVLCEHSILGRLMEGESDDPGAFERGLSYGAETGLRYGGLLKRLFSARTLGLSGELPAGGLRSYLSGLLIATEIREARSCLEQWSHDHLSSVAIIGGPALSSRYERALWRAGIDGRIHTTDAAARGLSHIARAAGLIGG